MRVKTREERQVVAARCRLMRLALVQNAVGVGLQHSADRVQALFRRPIAPVGQRNSVQATSESVRST